MTKITADQFHEMLRADPTGATLPAGLSVGGSLDLSGCTGLTTLPAGLSVGRWLDLYCCTGLTGGIIRGGTDARDYEFFGYLDAERGFRVVAGCRNFSPEEARAHWPEGSECRALAESVIARQGELA